MLHTEKKQERLSAPNPSGNVWPGQSCPALLPRGGAAEQTCWYCVYADFHLDRPRALEVGICEWPHEGGGEGVGLG